MGAEMGGDFFWFSRERGDANEIMEWNTYRHTLYGDGEYSRELDNESINQSIYYILYRHVFL